MSVDEATSDLVKRAKFQIEPSQDGNWFGAKDKIIIRELVDTLLSSQARVAAAEAAKDGAYLERNQVVAGFAMLSMTLGYRAGRARTVIEGWEPKWHGCVYIDLPTGQVSWHYHDSQDYLFEWLPTYDAAWDGHDTPEKYRRVLAITEDDPPNARAESAEAKLEAKVNLCRQVCDNYANKTAEAEAEVARLSASLAEADAVVKASAWVGEIGTPEHWRLELLERSSAALAPAPPETPEMEK